MMIDVIVEELKILIALIESNKSIHLISIKIKDSDGNTLIIN